MSGMFWSGRVPSLLLALVLATAGSGCGFRPMMGEQDSGLAMSERLDQVDIGFVPDRSGQQLRNLLIDRFYRDGRPDSTLYRLEISLSTAAAPMGLQKDALASRGQWDITVSYRLLHIASGALMFQASSRAMPGFSFSSGQYATMVSESGALERGLVQVADDIRSRVAMFLARPEDQKPAVPGVKVP